MEKSKAVRVELGDIIAVALSNPVEHAGLPGGGLPSQQDQGGVLSWGHGLDAVEDQVFDVVIEDVLKLFLGDLIGGLPTSQACLISVSTP